MKSNNPGATESDGMHLEAMERELAFLNLDRTRGFVLITLVIEFVLGAADDYILHRITASSMVVEYYTLMFAALMVMSLLYLLAIPRLERLLENNRISPHTVKIILIFYFTLALCWGAIMSVQNHSMSGNASAFIVVLMLGSLLLFLDSYCMMFPYLAAILIFILSGFHQSGAGPGLKHYLNLAIYMMLAWSISRTLYSSYASEFTGRCLIEMQNRMLKETNQNMVKEAALKQEVQERLEMANRELVNLSLIDDLTGIANRRNLDFFLNYEWNRSRREGTPLSILMIDIDNFKAFNDHYGHVNGDQALTRVAAQLNYGRRRSTDFVARYGGEEFLFIALNIDEEGTCRLAEMLRRQIEELEIPHAYSPVSPWVTISLGTITLIPGEVQDIREAIHMADRALYEAKQAGGNTVRTFYSPQDTLF
ncbi:MAG TPA: diguanylate cyclase [Syntrophomonadaceae bacterium]|nr:diguanylate cyclase [Syntrophomonadaceae bacterium]